MNTTHTSKKTFIRNKTTARVLVILIVITCIIQGAIIMCVGQYLRQEKITTPANFVEKSHDIIRYAQLLQLTNYNVIKKNQHIFQTKGLRLQLTNEPAENSYVVNKTDLNALIDYIKLHINSINISINKKNNQWAIITRTPLPSQPFIWGYPLVAGALFIALILLYFWSASRLSIPFDDFLKASKRFGIDLNAPPMALQGSEEMREAIQGFNQMQARIRRLVNDRTQMLAAISHDLRTPITRLQLRAEYLQGTSQYEKALADLHEMEHMITSILAFSRDHASTDPIELFDMNALLETLCDDLSDTGKNVHYSALTERVPAEGRLLPLKRAITNLIENAVKYGKQASVSIDTSHANIQIKIVDQGPGIAEHQMAKVFEPFYRIDPSRTPDVSGSGLGMAVSRDIIRAHGGDITLINTDPKGLTVIVSLPQH